MENEYTAPELKEVRLADGDVVRTSEPVDVIPGLTEIDASEFGLG